jgi:hypothetical protein
MDEGSVTAAAAVGAAFATFFMFLAVRRANSAARGVQDV